MKEQPHKTNNCFFTIAEQWFIRYCNPIAFRLMFSGKTTALDIREAVRWEKEH